MRQEYKQLFEDNANEYITPHYWNYLEDLVAVYLEAGSPSMSKEMFFSIGDTNKTTFSRFSTRFFGKPTTQARGKFRYGSGSERFWNLLQEVWVMERNHEEQAGSEVQDRIIGVSSGPIV